MKCLRSSKGFTLIEVMIVIAIIGILLSIAVPQFMKHMDKEVKYKQHLQQSADNFRDSMLMDNPSRVGGESPLD